MPKLPRMGNLFKPKEKCRASHILVKDKSAAQKLHQELRGGADFASLARQHSECPSKANGGDLGEFGRGAMVKEFDRVAFGLTVGELSEPVQTRFGYHLIRRTG